MEEEQIFKLLKKRFIGGITDFFLYFIFYVGVILYFTKGYTLGGYIVGTKIVSTKEKDISIISYCLRMLYALYAIQKFGAFTKVKVNSLGQLSYDEKFNTTVLFRDIEIKALKNTKKDYEFNMH